MQVLDTAPAHSPRVVSLGTFLTKQESTAPGRGCTLDSAVTPQSRRSTRHTATFSASGKYRLCLGFSSPHKGHSPLRGPRVELRQLPSKGSFFGPSRGARGALPVADTATRASGSGRYFPRSAVDEGKYRAPQQDRVSLRVGSGDGYSAKSASVTSASAKSASSTVSGVGEGRRKAISSSPVMVSFSKRYNDISSKRARLSCKSWVTSR